MYEILDTDTMNAMLKDEKYAKEFANLIVFEEMSKPKAFCQVFQQDYPLAKNLEMKMYRWIKKEATQRWLKKANTSLEVDWIDKRVNALGHLYSIGMAGEAKTNVEALDKFLGHLNKEQNKLVLDMGNSQVNIVQVVQDKLSSITQGATIQPDVKAIEDNSEDTSIEYTEVEVVENER